MSFRSLSALRLRDAALEAERVAVGRDAAVAGCLLEAHQGASTLQAGVRARTSDDAPSAGRDRIIDLDDVELARGDPNDERSVLSHELHREAERHVREALGCLSGQR